MADNDIGYPGMHAFSPERTMEDLRNHDHGHVVADGQTEEVLEI